MLRRIYITSIIIAMAAFLLHGTVPHCHHWVQWMPAFECAAMECGCNSVGDHESHCHSDGLSGHATGSSHAHGCSVHTLFRFADNRISCVSHAMLALVPCSDFETIIIDSQRLLRRVERTLRRPTDRAGTIQTLRAPPGLSDYTL